MSADAKFWQETKKVIPVTKLRKIITLPAFSIRCGELNSSLFFTSRQTGTVTFGAYTTAANSLKDIFTIEFWYNTNSSFTTRGRVFSNFRNVSGGSNISISFLNRKIEVRVLKTAVENVLTSAMDYSQGKWSHIAVTYDGTTIKMYQDGVQDANTLVIVANLDSDAANLYGSIIGSKDNLTEFYIGYLNEIRVWTIALTKEQIQANRFAYRGKNLGLSRYYKLNEKSGSLITVLNDSLNIITAAVDNTNIIPTTTVFAPLKLGASSIFGQFDVVSDVKLSIKYPVKKPSDINFMLCIRWIDDDSVIQRRHLWDMIGVDIAPSPARYRGEKISKNFTFEVWNIDGEDDCTMISNLIINVSKYSLPQIQNDIIQVALISNPVIDISLGANFPAVFPIVFNDIQWGIVAAPVAQPTGTLSVNLTNYGAIQ